MRLILSVTITCAFAALGVAQSTASCAAPPPYYTNPAYGVSSGCVPTNYNSGTDLGNTNPTDAATRCAQQCSRLTTCGGWVAQLNKAADSGLYTGSCFFYTSLPATPRSCVDKPSQLVAGARDDTAKCFSSSSAVATAFCSSYLQYGTKTITVTAATPTVKNTSRTTNIILSTSTVVASSTNTISPTVKTSTATAYSFATASVTYTDSTTRIETQTNSETVTSTQTTILISTVYTTATITVTPAARVRRAVSSPQPACVASGIPASQLKADCSCLGIKSKTVTATVTPAAVTRQVTLSTTSVSSVKITLTTLLTATAPVTLKVTQTSSSTIIVPVTITATETSSLITIVTVTVTATETGSSTTTAAITATATACVPTIPAGNILTNPGFNGGDFSGWNPGGYGGFSNTITDDAQCGPYGAHFTVTAASSYGRIGQRFTTIDPSKRYQIRTYAKLVSGDPTNCFYYVTCQKPGSFSSADNVIVQTPAANIPADWTEFIVTCPLGANALTMSISLQCNQGSGPVTVALDETAMYPVS